MTEVRIEIDEDALRKLLAEPGALRAVDDVTGQLAAVVVRNAPLHSGRFQDSIEQGPTVVEDDVATGIIYSTDPMSHLVEFGSENNPPYRPFTRSAIDSGFRFEDARA